MNDKNGSQNGNWKRIKVTKSQQNWEGKENSTRINEKMLKVDMKEGGKKVRGGTGARCVTTPSHHHGNSIWVTGAQVSNECVYQPIEHFLEVPSHVSSLVASRTRYMYTHGMTK